MNKAYGRIEWENYPSEKTPLNEDNLNKIDAALDEVDNRVVTMDMTKLDLNTANGMVKNVSFNEKSGIFTITYLNGSTKELDTKLEKIATNFRYDYNTQKLILTLVDGTTQEIDMKALITQYEFENSAYISWTVTADGKIKADIINGSITADKLQPNFLADVTLQANNAKTSEQNAKISEENAKESEINAKNYADSAEPIASTVSGLNPMLESSTHAPIISFEGKGATEQQAYSGKNILPITLTDGTQQGISYAVDKTNGVITFNGTATAAIPINIATNVKGGNFLELNTEYIISFGEDVASNPNVLMVVGIRIVGGDTYEYPVYVDGSKETKFKLTEEYEELLVRVRFDKGTTVSNFKVYPMIRLATETDDTYEKFVGGTASPNPDYPQEIHGVGESGSVAVKSTCANALKLTAEKEVIRGGVTFTQVLDENGLLQYINVNGTATGSVMYNLCELFDTSIYSDGTYTISFGEEFAKTNAIMVVGYQQNKGDVNTYPVYTRGVVSKQFTLAENMYSVIIRIRSEAGDTFDNVKVYPMISKGDTALPYEPYVETTANIPIDVPLYEGDYIKYSMDGSGCESHKQHEMILDGSETWIINGTDDYLYYSTDIGQYNSVVNHSIKCTHFSQAQITSNTTHKGINVLNSPGASVARIAVRPNIDGVTDVDTWKAWLAENKPKVVYELAEPTVTPLTAEQIAEFKKLYSFDGVTNVMCEGNVAVDYFMDSVSGKVVAAVVSKVNNSVKKIEDADSKATQALIYGSDPILSAFDYESGSKENEISTTMTMKQAIQHLQNAVNDIANGVSQNKEKIEALLN